MTNTIKPIANTAYAITITQILFIARNPSVYVLLSSVRNLLAL